MIYEREVLYHLELLQWKQRITCSRVFTVSRGVVITDEQAPATIPAVA
jgi:hypothetical protein